MKRILTNKEYRFIKGLKELMIKYNAVISTDAQGKIEIVVNEDNESFDFEAESTIYLGACFSDYELNELLEKNFAHIKRINECPHVTKLAKFKLPSCPKTMFWNTLCRI